jgi:SAM-dependent methyltransferase
MAEKQIWERAEIQRSIYEAGRTADAALVADEVQVARYLNPPPTTVYPLEYAYSLLGNVAGRTVLDFGCGSGQNSLLLARRGARVIGIDISESLIRVALKRLAVNGLAGGADFIVASAHDLPVRTASIDIVLGIAILHHLDLRATSREVLRVLKPGGRAIFQEPVRDSRVVRTIRRLVPYHAPDVSPFERPLTTPELDDFGLAFRRVTMRPFMLPFVNITRVVPALRRHIHSAHRLDGAIIKRVPSVERLTGIRVLELVK